MRLQVRRYGGPLAERANAVSTRSVAGGITTVRRFCGIGKALVIANRHGFHTVGVEWNRRRAEQARTLTMDDIRAADAERLAMRERRGPRHKRG